MGCRMGAERPIDWRAGWQGGRVAGWHHHGQRHPYAKCHPARASGDLGLGRGAWGVGSQRPSVNNIRDTRNIISLAAAFR